MLNTTDRVYLYTRKMCVEHYQSSVK